MRASVTNLSECELMNTTHKKDDTLMRDAVFLLILLILLIMRQL